MNNSFSDCLRQTRIYEGNDLTSYLSENPPRGLDSEKLSTLGYKIDGNKKNCNNIGIKPKNEKEKNLFSIEFLITDTEKDGVRLAKVATPSSNPSFLNSCKSWAGEDCII